VVRLVDDGGQFPVPVDIVWAFVSSGDAHSHAHRHRNFRRRRLPGNAGRYTWEQPFLGRTERFTMRWRSYYPLGVAYDVLEGPFTGSRFFLYYTPHGPTTGVTIVGEFVSPTLHARRVPGAVRRFFDLEFRQDGAALRAWARERPTSRPPRRRRRGPVGPG
jgi:hypothetical protein